MVCWKAGADPEGLPWYTEDQGDGYKAFTMVCWKQGRIQRVYHVILKTRTTGLKHLPWSSGRRGIQRVYNGML